MKHMIRRISLARVYEGGLLAILLLIVVHAPLTVGFGNLWPEVATIIKAWKEVLLIGLAAIAVVLITRRKLWHQVLRNRLILLCLVFIDIHLLLALIMPSDAAATIAGLMIDLRFIVMFMLMYVLILIRPQALTRVKNVIGLGAAIIIGFGLLQITVLPDNVLSRLGYSDATIRPFTTIDRNPDFVRINSTLRGPNPLGALAVVYATLAVAYLVVNRARIDARRKWQAIAAGVGGFAVLFASFSRSAYLALLAAVIVIVTAVSRPSRKIILAGGVATVVATIGLLVVSSSDWFSNVILHEDPESSVQSKSNEEHVASLAGGVEHVLSQPFGAGIGSTGSASLYDDETSNDAIIENYYLFVAHESGWLGLASFLAIFGWILVRLWKRRGDWLALGLFASGIGLGLIGLLLPVWADETVALIWWGLAGAVLAHPSGIIGGRHAKRARQQKTTRAT